MRLRVDLGALRRSRRRRSLSEAVSPYGWQCVKVFDPEIETSDVVRLVVEQSFDDLTKRDGSHSQ